ISLRVRKRHEEVLYKVRPNLRARGIDWPLFALLGVIGTGISWFVIVAQNPATRWTGLGWLAFGFVFYTVYRRRFVHAPLTETVRAPMLMGPAIALEYRTILVPLTRGPESEEAVDVACRLATERRARVAAVSVLELPLDLPLDAELPEQERQLDELLDGAWSVADSYGVHMALRIARSRRAGQAIVEEATRRNSEIIVMGARRHGRGRSREIFGGTVDYVLRHAPCRVMVVAPQGAAT
ncbi:MAG: universal stress protein, partial [Gaiellaceae bacterium]